MQIRKQIAVLLLSLCVFALQAQDTFNKFSFEASGFYGLSGLTGTMASGKITPGLSYQFQLGGAYYFSKSLGAGIGAGYANYTSQSLLDNYTSTSNTPARDSEGENFEYRVTASGIKELQSLSALEVPVFIAFRTDGENKAGLNINAGLKFSLPLSANYQCTGGSLTTKGYYPAYNVEFSDMPNHGFETINSINYSGKLNAVTATSVFGNISYLIPLGKVGLNLGVYGSYGLSSVLKPSSKLLIDYPGSYNSLTSLSSSVSLISAGVRIGVSF